MKLTVAAMILVSTTLGFAQTHQQEDVPEIFKMVQESKKLIRDFEVDKSERLKTISTPDYRLAHQHLISILKSKENLLPRFLGDLNEELRNDFTIIRNLRSIRNKNDALERTLKEAESRFHKKVSLHQDSYKRVLKKFINDDLLLPQGLCLSVLCMEMISEDIVDAFDLLKKINKDLKVEDAKLKKLSKKEIKKDRESLALSMSSHKAGVSILALTAENQDCQNLMDVKLDDALLLGVSAIAEKGLEQARKERQEEAAFLAKFNDQMLDKILRRNGAKLGSCSVTVHGGRSRRIPLYHTVDDYEYYQDSTFSTLNGPVPFEAHSGRIEAWGRGRGRENMYNVTRELIKAGACGKL